MATCLDTVTYAMRSLALLASGETPSSQESTDGLVALQSFYDELVMSGIFGRLEDIYLTGDDIAQEGKRYLLAAGVTLTEPTIILADVTEDGEDRQPRDLSLYEKLTSTGTLTRRLYDRTSWVNLTGLALTDTAPLSGRGAMGLAAAVACSGGFSDMFGATAGTALLARSQRFLSSLSHKLGSSRDRLAAEYM
jgi:hypothetical protein